MKTLMGILLLAASGFFLHAYAIDEGASMKDILSTMKEYVEYLEDSLSQEIVHMHADIITDDGITFTRTLHKGWTYGIAAFADWRVKDLDITIYKDLDGEWKEVAKDGKADNHPVVSISPSATGQYLIKLTVYKFSGEYTGAHYGMIIFHEYEE